MFLQLFDQVEENRTVAVVKLFDYIEENRTFVLVLDVRTTVCTYI